MPFVSVRRAAVLGILVSGCYTADLDPEVSAVYVCEIDVDCALGQSCLGGVCLNEADAVGPQLEIIEPPLLDVYPQGTSVLEVSFRGRDLFLTSQNSEELNAGYVEVYLDGALVDTVTDGPIGSGIDLYSVQMPEVAGLHHIVLTARRLDGQPFDNAASEAHVAFWVDDGREHVGILYPPPSARITNDDREIGLEIAALNFTFVNPGFLPVTEETAPAQGYVHLYLDANVPTCLPSCNFDYQNSIIPAGLSRVNRIAAEQNLILPDGVGTIRLQIVAQTTSHTPYYRNADTTDVVYDEIPVQSVLGVGQ